MTADVQQIFALALVALAAASVGLRLWRQARGKAAGGGSCPGCGECGRPRATGARPAPKATPLVTLGGAGAPPRLRPTPAQQQRTSDG